MRSNLTALRLARSIRRPGVAMTTWWLFQLGDLGGDVGTSVPQPRAALQVANFSSCSAICCPSSLVGASTKAGRGPTRCQGGRAASQRPRSCQCLLGQTNEIAVTLKQQRNRLCLDVGGRLEPIS